MTNLRLTETNLTKKSHSKYNKKSGNSDKPSYHFGCEKTSMYKERTVIF
jgi:hypothetical protein